LESSSATLTFDLFWYNGGVSREGKGNMGKGPEVISNINEVRADRSTNKTLGETAVMYNKHGNKTSLVGPEVVAKTFGVSRNTVLNWARENKIPHVKIGKTYRFSLKIISEAVNHPLEAA